jgi:hypothetical protein
MSLKTCVLFAVGIGPNTKLIVLHEYLTMLKQNFADSKIYAGINLTANLNVEPMLDQSGLDLEFKRVTDPNFHVDSDASAYQLALKMMMESGEKYDVVWFVHTKGGFHERDDIRQLYMENFFPRRKYIETKFEELEHLGVFGYRAGHYNWNNETNDKCLDISDRLIRDIWDGKPTPTLPYSYCKYIIVETMFAMKADILYKFLEEYPEFFDTHINRFPTGKWFIELELCNIIPTRMGYYPVVFNDYDDYIHKNLQFTIDNWIEENKLYHLSDYKTKLEDRKL